MLGVRHLQGYVSFILGLNATSIPLPVVRYILLPCTTLGRDNTLEPNDYIKVMERRNVPPISVWVVQPHPAGQSPPLARMTADSICFLGVDNINLNMIHTDGKHLLNSIELLLC